MKNLRQIMMVLGILMPFVMVSAVQTPVGGIKSSGFSAWANSIVFAFDDTPPAYPAGQQRNVAATAAISVSQQGTYQGGPKPQFSVTIETIVNQVPQTVATHTFTYQDPNDATYDQANYSYAFTITLPAAIGEYVYTAKVTGKRSVDSPEEVFSSSDKAYVYSIEMSETPTICAGGSDDSVHKGSLKVRVTSGETGIAGVSVIFSLIQAINDLPAAYKPTLMPTSASSNAQGYATVDIKSGISVLTNDSFQQVGVIPSSGGVSFSPITFPIAEPSALTLDLIDAVTGENRSFIYTDGDAVKVRSTETFTQNGSASPVNGHGIEWSFKFWIDGHIPGTDPPDFDSTVDGYTSAVYGTLCNPSGTTVNGQYSATFITGTEPGWVEWSMKDANVLKYHINPVP